MVVDHGSKAAAAAQEFDAMVALVATRFANRSRVRGAHMELCLPLLVDVLKEELRDDNTRVMVMPYFLFHGRHVEKDIPAIARAANCEAWDQGRVVVAAPFGVHELAATLVEVRIEEALLLAFVR